MRIALCGDGRSPHSQRWANAVVERGHEVAFVWLREDIGGTDLTPFHASISHHAVVPRTSLGRAWRVPFAHLAARALGRRLGPDLVHGLYLSGYGWTAHALGARPLVLSALGSDVLDLDPGAGGSALRRAADAYRARRTRAAVTAADVVLTDSTALATAVRERVPGTDVRIVRFGVDVDRTAPTARPTWRRRLGIPDDAFVLLSSRLVRPHYNIDAVIRALPAVCRRLPHAVLVLKELPAFSDPVYRDACLQLIDELGLRDAVRVVGELGREELLDLYAAADVYVSVPKTDGTAVSVLEAMVAGAAVVASDAPGIDPEILRHGDTALLVGVGDVDALAEAIASVGADDARRRTLVERARRVVREHGDFERELDRAVLLYEALVSGKQVMP